MNPGAHKKYLATPGSRWPRSLEMILVGWVRASGLAGCHLGTCQLHRRGALNSASNCRHRRVASVSVYNRTRTPSTCPDRCPDPIPGPSKHNPCARPKRTHPLFIFNCIRLTACCCWCLFLSVIHTSTPPHNRTLTRAHQSSSVHAFTHCHHSPSIIKLFRQLPGHGVRRKNHPLPLRPEPATYRLPYESALSGRINN